MRLSLSFPYEPRRASSKRGRSRPFKNPLQNATHFCGGRHPRKLENLRLKLPWRDGPCGKAPRTPVPVIARAKRPVSARQANTGGRSRESMTQSVFSLLLPSSRRCTAVTICLRRLHSAARSSKKHAPCSLANFLCRESGARRVQWRCMADTQNAPQSRSPLCAPGTHL